MSIQAKDLNLNCRFRQNSTQGEGLVLRFELRQDYPKKTDVILCAISSWLDKPFEKPLGEMNSGPLVVNVPLVSTHAGEHTVDLWLKVNDGILTHAFHGGLVLTINKAASLHTPQQLSVEVHVDASEQNENDLSNYKTKPPVIINLGTPGAPAAEVEDRLLEVPLTEQRLSLWPGARPSLMGMVNRVLVGVFLAVSIIALVVFQASQKRGPAVTHQQEASPITPIEPFKADVPPSRPVEKTAGDIYPALKKSCPLLAATSGTKPFTNSLGMSFVMFRVNQRDEAVLFSQMETRVSDFRQFMVDEHRTTERGEFDATGQGTICRGSWDNPGFTQEPDHPVVWVTSIEARDFCLWLTLKERASGHIQNDWAYSLPLKEEWLSVFKQLYGSRLALYDKLEGNWADSSLARTGPESQIVIGRDPARPCMVGYDDTFAFTSPAGAANSRSHLPLFDMAGNVFEFTYGTYPKMGARWASACGGACNVGVESWIDFDDVFEHEFYELGRYPFVGFRIVLSPSPSARNQASIGH